MKDEMVFSAKDISPGDDRLFVEFKVYLEALDEAPKLKRQISELKAVIKDLQGYQLMVQNVLTEIESLKVDNDAMRTEMQSLRGFKELSLDVGAKFQKALAALNKVGMLGMGSMAYTADFTEAVNNIVRKVLEELSMKPK